MSLALVQRRVALWFWALAAGAFAAGVATGFRAALRGIEWLLTGHAGELVQVASQPAEMLGPWNVDHYQSRAGDEHEPVLYHFHSLRIFHPRWIQLCCGYNPTAAARIYARYLETLDGIDGRLAQRGIGRSCVPFAGDRWWLPRLGWRLATGRATVRHWPRRPIAAADAAQEFPPWESSPDSASNCPP